ncbi:MAG: hypothetical protein VX730_07375 [Pseudomonadota bacterium]|nr:hypothetical protein [Pseudomonadota bacterium]
MNLMSAVFTGQDHCVTKDGKKKPSQASAFTEAMFDEFRKEHVAAKGHGDVQVKESKEIFKKPKARTIANDKTMEQELATTPPLTY